MPGIGQEKIVSLLLPLNKKLETLYLQSNLDNVAYGICRDCIQERMRLLNNKGGCIFWPESIRFDCLRTAVKTTYDLNDVKRSYQSLPSNSNLEILLQLLKMRQSKEFSSTK